MSNIIPPYEDDSVSFKPPRDQNNSVAVIAYAEIAGLDGAPLTDDEPHHSAWCWDGSSYKRSFCGLGLLVAEKRLSIHNATHIATRGQHAHL